MKINIPLKFTLIFIGVLLLSALSFQSKAQNQKSNIKVGAYYYDGWCGKNSLADDPNEPWAKNAPRQLKKRMYQEFSDREPVWGWRDDDLAIMEKQIDLAADNGIEFFLFCWYWRDTKGPINVEAIEQAPAHTSMNLYLKARNKNRIKFGLLVANHDGAEIIGPENWGKATQYWMKYFKDPQYVKVDGKPLVVIFSTKGIQNGDMEVMQSVSKKEGLPRGLSIGGCGNTTDKSFDLRTHYNINPGYVAGHEAHKYSELIEPHKKNWVGTEKQPYIPEVTVGWDKRPWEDKSGNGKGGAKEGWYFPDRTPKEFKDFLKDAVTWMDQHPTQTTRERYMLVYAWNELGEGGYLVPTKGDPDASYLKMIREVVQGIN